MHFDFGDLGLGDIFGSFFGGSQRNTEGKKRGRDVETSIDLSFEEAVFGVEKEIGLTINDTCSHCNGSTAELGYEMKTCETCKGSGQVVQSMRTIFGNIQQASVCPTCKGSGKVPEKLCSVCHGKGVERKTNKIKLKIPAGIDDGATVRLRERGEAIAHGSHGDLCVHVRVRAHKKFTREGELILSEENIPMVDAALGTEINVATVDGPIKMKIPAGTQSGTDLKLSGHGVPKIRGSGRGAHIVTVIVDTPKKLSKQQVLS